MERTPHYSQVIIIVCPPNVGAKLLPNTFPRSESPKKIWMQQASHPLSKCLVPKSVRAKTHPTLFPSLALFAPHIQHAWGRITWSQNGVGLESPPLFDEHDIPGNTCMVSIYSSCCRVQAVRSASSGKCFPVGSSLFTFRSCITTHSGSYRICCTLPR